MSSVPRPLSVALVDLLTEFLANNRYRDEALALASGFDIAGIDVDGYELFEAFDGTHVRFRFPQAVEVELTPPALPAVRLWAGIVDATGERVLEIIDDVAGQWVEIRGFRLTAGLTPAVLRPLDATRTIATVHFDARLRVDPDWTLTVLPSATVSLEPCEIVGTGIVVALEDITIDVSERTARAQRGTLQILPSCFFAGQPGLTVEAREIAVRPSGFSGSVRMHWALGHDGRTIDIGNGQVGHLISPEWSVGIEVAAIDFVDNLPQRFFVAGALRVPLLDIVLGVEFGMTVATGTIESTLRVTTAQPINILLPGGTLRIDELALQGRLAGDTFDIRGTLNGLDLTLGPIHLALASAEHSLVHDAVHDEFRVALGRVPLGPLGTVDGVSLRVSEQRDTTTVRRDVQFEGSVTWTDLRTRLAIPAGFPAPGDGNVRTTVAWQDNGTGGHRVMVHLSATIEDLTGLWSFLPAAYRPHVEAAELSIDLEYPDEAAFTAASSSTSLTGVVEVSVTVKLPMLPTLPGVAAVTTGDADGRVRGTLRMVVDDGGEPHASIVLTDPVGLDFRLPGSQSGAPVVRVNLDSISVGNGDRAGSGTFGFSGSVSTPSIETYMTSLVTQLGLRSGLNSMLRPLGQAMLTHGTFAFSVVLEGGNATPSIELVLSADAPPTFKLLEAIGAVLNPGGAAPEGVTSLPGLGAPSDFFEVVPGEMRLSATLAAQPTIRISASLDTTVFGETFDLTLALGVQEGDFDIALTAGSTDTILITAPIPDPVTLLGIADVNAIAATYGLNVAQRQSLAQLAQAFTDLAADLGPQGVFAFEISNFRLNVTSAGPAASGQVRLVQLPRFIEQLTPLTELRVELGAEIDKLFIEILRAGTSSGEPLLTVPLPGNVEVDVHFSRFMLAYAWGRNEFAFALDAGIVPSRTLAVNAGGSGIFLPAIDTDVQLGATVTTPPVPIPEGLLSFRRPQPQTTDSAVDELGLQAVIGAGQTRFVTAYLRELAFSPTYFLLWPGFRGDGGLVIGGPNPKDVATANAYLNVRQWNRTEFFARFTVTRGTLIFFDALLGVMLNPLAAVPPFITANPPYWITPPFYMGDLFADEIGMSLNIPGLVFIDLTFERPLPSFSLQAVLEFAALAAGGFARPIPAESSLRKVFFARLSAFVQVRLPGLSPANSSVDITLEANVADLMNGMIDIMHKAKATLDAGSDLLGDVTRDPSALVRMVPREARRLQHEITFGGFRLSGSVYLMTPDELHDELRLFFENKRRRPRGIAANQQSPPPPATTPVNKNPDLFDHVPVSRRNILDSRSLVPDMSVVAARSVKMATDRLALNAGQVTTLTRRREQNIEEAATAVAGALANLQTRDAAKRRAALAALDLEELGPRVEAVLGSSPRGTPATALTAALRSIIVEAMRTKDEAIVGESALPALPEEIADTLIKRIVSEPSPTRTSGSPASHLRRSMLPLRERTAEIDRLIHGSRPRRATDKINTAFDRLNQQLEAAQSNMPAADRAIAEAKRQIASALSEEFGFTRPKVSELRSMYPTSATIAAKIQSNALTTWRKTPLVTSKLIDVITFNAPHFGNVLRGVDIFRPPPADGSDTVEAVAGYQIQTKDGSGGVAVPVPSGSAAYKVVLDNGRYRLLVRQRDRTWVAHDLPQAFVRTVASGPDKPALLRDRLVVAPRTVRRRRTQAERNAVQEQFDQADTLYLTSILVRPEYEVKPTGGLRGPFYVADLLRNGSTGAYTVPSGVTLLGGFTLSLFGNELRLAGMIVADQQQPSVFLYGYSRLTCVAGGLRLVAEGQFVLSAGTLWGTIPLPSGAVTSENAIGFSGHVAVKRGSDTLFEGSASGHFSRAASGAVTAALKVQVSSEGSIDLGVADTEFARIAWTFSGELDVHLTNQSLAIATNATASVSADLATYATRWVVDVPAKRVCVPWYYVDSLIPPAGHWGTACTTTPEIGHLEIDFSTVDWERLASARCGIGIAVANSGISFTIDLGPLGTSATELIDRTTLTLSDLL